jgi:hypothetical protein
VPLWDEWTELDALATAPNHQVPISWLWAQHSEHRVVFYRLLLLADIHLFQGRHWIEFGAMLFVQLLSLVVLASLLRFVGLNATLSRAIVGLGAFALFCPTQWENFGWAFQISFLLPTFFLMFSLAALLKYEDSVLQSRPEWHYLGISILSAFAATFSNANGVVLWPLLLLAAIAIVRRIEVLASFVGFGVASIALYLHHYVSPGYHSSPLESIRHPLAVFTYVAGFLGVIVPAWVKARNFIAVSSGALGLLIGTALALWALTRTKREPLHIALLALTGFSVSTAFLAALGRIRFGLEQAFSSRYQTFNLLFWFSIGSLLLLYLDSTSSSLRSVSLAAITAVMLLAFLVFPLGLRASRTRTEQAEAASAALLSHVPDKDALAVLYDEPDLLWRDTDYFRQQHIFMFSDKSNGQIGKLLSANFTIGSDSQCRGEANTVKRLLKEDILFGDDAPVLQISGWAVTGSSKTPIERLVFASTSDRVVGYGASLAGSFKAKHSDIVRKKDFAEWLGFAQVPWDAASIQVYGVSKNSNELCHITEVELH